MGITEIFNLALPLTNPVLIFSLILFIILFIPLILNRFSIPSLIGLIIAGAVIGPFGFNLIARDSSIELFGTVGLLYIMFISSLEMDMPEFKKNSVKSIIFGCYTFFLPMILTIAAGRFLLQYSWMSSILLGSMIASNTLITYPIVSKLGISKNRSVNISIGGTILATIGALLVLAVIVAMNTGELSGRFWFRITTSFIISSLIIFLVFPLVCRWFFKKFDDSVSQYIFVLGLVFLGAYLAEISGFAPIVGAFFVGIALNRLIPQTSALMNRIEFVGNALFIPFFLIGVGMLINFRAFIGSFEAIYVAAMMAILAIVSKYVAAWLAQKSLGFNRDERSVMFGLTNAQAAATLAAVLVGYNVILGYDEAGNPLRMLDENVLNGTVLMILITCTIASFATQKGAINIAASESNVDDSPDVNEVQERILIPLSYPENVEELVNLGVTVKSPQKHSKLVGLNILDSAKPSAANEKTAQKLMLKATKIAASTDSELIPVIRYDTNLVNGVTNVVSEHKITDIIIGLHQKKGISDSFLGTLGLGILQRCNTTTMIYRPLQPISTINRNIIFVPDNAEKELGFPFWLVKVWNIGKNTGAKLVFYGSQRIVNFLSAINENNPIDAEFNFFDDWDDFLILGREMKSNDMLIFILSRKDYPSYASYMAKISTYLNKYFLGNNFLLIYPQQKGVAEHTDYDPTGVSMYEQIPESIEFLDDLLKRVGSLFRKNRNEKR